MKKITIDDQKRILRNMLKYITDICINNNIKYTLVGGSLIGAIRHQGMIPWDDDIDIAFMPEEFEKFKKIARKNTGRYKLLLPGDKDYYYPFAKLIDTKTIVIEGDIKEMPNYGVFVDVFKYHYVPNNIIMRKIKHRRQYILKRLLGFNITIGEYTKKGICKPLLLKVIRSIPFNFMLKRYLSVCKNSKDRDLVVYDWIRKDEKASTRKAKWFHSYTLCKFDNIQAMIIKQYDEPLRLKFGDYMELPPKENRISLHQIEAYWR